MASAEFVERVPFCPDCVMNLVTDVEKYPDFIPVMTALRKTSDTSDGFEAEAIIAYKGIRESFASKVTIDREAREVRVRKSGAGGPVKVLDNRWKFHRLSDGSTLVDFSVDVKLAMPLNFLLTQKFDKASVAIRDLFVQQAKDNCDQIDGEIDVIAEAKSLRLDGRLDRHLA